MIKEFKKYAGVKVLSYFLENPSTEVHIKELARILKISPSTSKRFCDLFTKESILLSKKKSNSIFFSLNNEESYVKELKRMYAVTLLSKNFNLKKEGIFNVSVYGSYASGDYSNNSDVDLIVISRAKNFDEAFISLFQKKIKKEVNVTKRTLSEWSQLKDDRDSFAEEILRNNFSLFGGKLK